jgi:hypothetical protein
VVAVALISAPVLAASPDPKDLGVSAEELSKARELVRRLGSEIYREREEAQAELAKMGRLAKKVLAEAVISDNDPEIRLRVSQLLPKANAADLQARIDTFMADTECKFEHELPGLKTFRKHLNSTERDKVRALYVEVLKSPYNMDMLAALDKGETEGGRAVADRRTAMWNDMQHRPFPVNGKPNTPRQPTLSDIAALLFAETIVAADSIPKNNGMSWINGTQFLQQPASMQALGGSSTAHVDAYKAIVRQWLATRTDAMELTNLAYQISNTPIKNFPESYTVLRRIVTTEGVQGYAKGQAVTALIQLRGKEEIPFLKGMLKDDSMIQQIWFGRPNGQAEMHTCLMKDVALANLISLGGGNIKDFAFETQQNVHITPGQLVFGQYAFTSEEKRGVGFMRWGWKQVKAGIDGPEKDPKDTKGTKENPGTPKAEPKVGDKESPKLAPAKPGIQAAPAPAGPLPAKPTAPIK